MLKLNNYPKYIQEFLIKSFANHSNLSIIETNDVKRLEEFILSTKDYPHIYVFDVKNGLRKTSVVDSRIIKYSEVIVKDSLTGVEQKIVSLLEAIEFYENQLDLFTESKQKSVFIASIDLVNEKELSFLRVLATESKYYENDAQVVIFVPSIEIFPIHLRNISTEIDVELSTTEERKAFLEEIVKSFNLELENKEQIIKQLAGLTLHDVNTVLLESIARTGKISLDIVSQFKEHMLKKNNLELTVKEQLGFKAIGGYDVVKEYIRDRIIKPLIERARAKALCKELPKGILFFGQAGTGKSLFAKAIGKELEIPVVELQTRHFLSKYVGESESNLKRALKIIDEMSPCVVFIDEIDALGSRGSGESDGGTMSRIFGQLLTWLNDQEDSIIIATTNEIQRIDHAMLRSGRLDQIVPVLLPDLKAREAILKVHAKIKRKVPLAQNVAFKELAKQTEFFTGAELEALVKSAIDEAFIENVETVTQKHFKIALENFSIDETERTMQLKRYVEQAKKFTRDKRFIAKLEAEQTGTLSRIEKVKQKLEQGESS